MFRGVRCLLSVAKIVFNRTDRRARERKETMKTHNLKIWPAGYARVAEGMMTSQVRRNDRTFRTGDRIRFYEWNPETRRFSGQTVLVEITDVTEKCVGIHRQYCVLSIRRATMATKWIT